MKALMPSDNVAGNISDLFVVSDTQVIGAFAETEKLGGLSHVQWSGRGRKLVEIRHVSSDSTQI